MSFSVAVVDYDSNESRYNEVIEELEKEFEKVRKRNPKGYVDSFEQSFDMHCQTVARRLGAKLRYDADDDVVFDFISGKIATLSQFRDALKPNQ